MINLDFSKYKGATLLKDWWGIVQGHLTTLQEAINTNITDISTANDKIDTNSDNIYALVHMKDDCFNYGNISQSGEVLSVIADLAENYSFSVGQKIKFKTTADLTAINLPTGQKGETDEGFGDLTIAVTYPFQAGHTYVAVVTAENAAAKVIADNEIDLGDKELSEKVDNVETIMKNVMPYQDKEHLIYDTGTNYIKTSDGRIKIATKADAVEGQIYEFKVNSDCNTINIPIPLCRANIVINYQFKAGHTYFAIVTTAMEPSGAVGYGGITLFNDAEARVIFDNGTFIDYVMGFTNVEISDVTKKVDDVREEMLGQDNITTYECIVSAGIPELKPQDSYSDELWITIPRIEIKIDGNTVVTEDNVSCEAEELTQKYVLCRYNTKRNSISIDFYEYVSPPKVGFDVDNEDILIFPLYSYDYDVDSHVGDDGDEYKVTRYSAEYASSNHDSSGNTYIICYEDVKTGLEKLNTDNKNSLLDAVNEINSKEFVLDVAVEAIRTQLGTMSSMLDTVNGE